MIVHSGTGKARKLPVSTAQSVKKTSHLNLTLGLRQVIFAIEAYSFRHVCIQIVERLHADTAEHSVDIALCMRKILK